jgi:antitoxin component YwqK of YwqJK toxin-antitoxin module
MKTIALQLLLLLLACECLLAQEATTRNEEVQPPRNFTGQWVAWYPNGQKKCECRYIKGQPEGKWIHWYDNGVKTTEIDYDKGQVHGHHTTWHKNAKQASQATFEHGEQTEPWVYWTIDGVLKDGVEVTFYEPGKKESEEHYVKGRRHGLLTKWHSNGNKRSEEQYKDGVLHGLARTWHYNGVLASESEYQNGKRQGRQVSWYPNGWKEDESVNDNDKHIKRIPIPGDDDPKAWGIEQAQADLAKGTKRIYHYGLPADGGLPLKDRTSGLPLEIVAGCDVQAAFAEKIDAYNDTMRAAVKVK